MSSFGNYFATVLKYVVGSSLDGHCEAESTAKGRTDTLEGLHYAPKLGCFSLPPNMEPIEILHLTICWEGGIRARIFELSYT